ncbi:MAG: XRE family transcriptional regulator [Betaproteobacteria bacterium]|nr:XRE family transcriptional regulator [Betaproteobacteria bacterium]
MQRQVGKRLTASRIGERFAELRRHRGMTQDQLAERLQVERETVSRFERGVTDLSISKVLEICDILEVPVATLITRASDNVSDYRVRIEEALQTCLPEDRELLCDTLERLADRLGKQSANEPSGLPGG